MEKLANETKIRLQYVLLELVSDDFLPNYWENVESNFANTEKEFFVFTDGEIEDSTSNITTVPQKHLILYCSIEFNIINKARKSCLDLIKWYSWM